MNRGRNHNGQAVVELGIFAVLILLILGVLFSYMQRLNDQQYVQMESFRRALEKACNGPQVKSASGGAGAAVQMTLMQNRRQADLSGSFKKGSTQALSANSSVFWAVPFVGNQAENVVNLRVNEDELELDNPDNFEGISDIETSSTSSFKETEKREESPTAIINSSQSALKDTITTRFVDDKGNTVWQVDQGLYRDPADGQYKYKSSQVGTEVTRQETWTTGF